MQCWGCDAGQLHGINCQQRRDDNYRVAVVVGGAVYLQIRWGRQYPGGEYAHYWRQRQFLDDGSDLADYYIDHIGCGGAYGFGQLGCPQSGGAGHRYMATRVGTGIIGNGDIYVGDGVLHAITGGMLIDSFNQKMTATTLAANSDGTFWTTGDLAEDPCGDQGTVTASAGAVSGVTITLAGYAEAGSTGECPASGGNIYWRPKFQATPNGTTGENAFQTPFSVSLTSYTWTQGTLLQFGGVAKLATFGTATSVPLHLASAQTTAPVLTSCGTGSPTIVGSDTAGTITMGTSATGCIATFNVSYTSAPHCTVTWRATPLLSQSYVVAAATITLTQTSASGNLVDYVCVAPAGGEHAGHGTRGSLHRR